MDFAPVIKKDNEIEEMFFNPEKVAKLGYLINFIVSERGGGKTFSSIKWCVEQFLENGDCFVYMRRLAIEYEESAPTLFKNLQVEGYFTDHTFEIKGNTVYCDKKFMCKFVSLKSAYKIKSVAFPNVKTIIFDEFISENVSYLRNETTLFLSALETIGRMRDYRVLLLGNQDTINNPYYLYFQVKPEGKTFTKYKSKSILIYRFSSDLYKAKKLDTKFGRLIAGTPYGDFMLNNENINDNYDFVDDAKGIKKYPIVNMIIENTNIVAYDIIMEDEYLIYFQTKEPVKTVKTLNFDKVLTENSIIEDLRRTGVCKKLINYSRKGMVKFKDIPTKRLVESIIF